MQAGRYAPIIVSIVQLAKNAILRLIKSYFNLWGFPIGKRCLRNTSERLVIKCRKTNSTAKGVTNFSPSSKTVYIPLKTPTLRYQLNLISSAPVYHTVVITKSGSAIPQIG